LRSLKTEIPRGANSDEAITLTFKFSTQLAQEFPVPTLRSEAELEEMLKDRQSEKARGEERRKLKASGTNVIAASDEDDSWRHRQTSN
jgi:hypothetical protein